MGGLKLDFFAQGVSTCGFLHPVEGKSWLLSPRRWILHLAGVSTGTIRDPRGADGISSPGARLSPSRQLVTQSHRPARVRYLVLALVLVHTCAVLLLELVLIFKHALVRALVLVSS